MSSTPGVEKMLNSYELVIYFITSGMVLFSALITALFVKSHFKKNWINKFISFLLFLFFLNDLSTHLFFSGNINAYPSFSLFKSLIIGIGFPVFFLVGSTSIYKSKIRSWWIIIHVILLLLNSFQISNVYLFQEAEIAHFVKLFSLPGHSLIWNFEFIQSLFLPSRAAYLPILFYLILSVYFLFFYKRTIYAYFKNKKVTVVLLVFLIENFVSVFVLNNGIEFLGKYYLINIISLIFSFGFIICTFFIPNFLYHELDLDFVPEQDNIERDNEVSMHALTGQVRRKKMALIDKIDIYFVENKPFLSSDFNLRIIEADLGISKKYISIEIKRKYDCGFNEFLNIKRLEYFKNEYLDKTNLKEKSLSDIAFDLGFGSISNFYTHFKLIIGCTPKEFMEQY